MPRELSPHNNSYRWRSLNLVNFAIGQKNINWNRKTIEFRLPECSLIDYDVKNWIRLFVNFVDWAKNQEMPRNIIGEPVRRALFHMGLGHEKSKFYILDRELLNAKTWFLRRLIRLNRYNRFTTEESKKILNEMWSPVRIFT